MAEKNLKAIRQDFKDHGVFYTNSTLAKILKSYIPFNPQKVYDPTCGCGNLLAVFDDKTEKYGQELYEDQLNIATENLKNFHGYVGDTLNDDGFKEIKFDCIVANPPFSTKGSFSAEDKRFKQANVQPLTSKLDYAFLLHIIYHLADDGVAAVLGFPGILYRGGREGEIRQWMIENNLIDRVVAIPQNSFTDTTVATCILVLKKSKSTTDIVFEDKELEQERTVSFEEIKDNNYNLSVSNYIQPEDTREKINIDELNAELRDVVARENELRDAIDALIAEIEG